MKKITIAFTLLLTLFLDNKWAAVAEMPFQTEAYGMATLRITTDTGLRALILPDGTTLILISEACIGRHLITGVCCETDGALGPQEINAIVAHLNSTNVLLQLDKLREEFNQNSK